MTTSRETIIARRGYPPLIDGDELSLKIASYPIAARYLGKRLSPKGSSIVELCCGVGVSLIEFSKFFDKVIGIDNDSSIIKAARNNIVSAGAVNCEVRVGDVRDVKIFDELEVDIAVYDIPFWNDHGDSKMTANPSLKTTIEFIRSHLTQNIVVYTPAHMRFDEVMSIDSEFEYQEVWINGKHDRNFIYFGSLAEFFGRTKIKLKN